MSPFKFHDIFYTKKFEEKFISLKTKTSWNTMMCIYQECKIFLPEIKKIFVRNNEYDTGIKSKITVNIDFCIFLDVIKAIE